MSELSPVSEATLWVLLALTGFFAVAVLWWQVQVLRGKPMSNPDGSVDSWHEQRTHYGIAVADLVWACPASLIGIVLVVLDSPWGFYLLALASAWAIWANTMTTATSLRFQSPKITLAWLLVFPFPGLVGLAYVLWSVANFNNIYIK